MGLGVLGSGGGDILQKAALGFEQKVSSKGN